MKFLVLALLLLGGSYQAAQATQMASSQGWSLVYEEVDKAFYNKNSYPDYFAGWCSNNVYRLAKRLQEAKVNLKNTEVVLIFKRDEQKRLDFIYPQYPRSWAGSGWIFHAVLNYEGVILDLDFYQEPTYLDLQAYFKTMFLYDSSNQGPNSDLLVKIISAEEYLRVYVRNYAEYPRRLFIEAADKIYPPMPALDYLKEQEKK